MKRIGKIILVAATLVLSCTRERNNSSVIIRISQDPESLNPVQYSNVAATQLISLLYQSLLVIDFATNKFQPLLVEEMPDVKLQADTSFYTFHVRKEAAWSDASSVEATDVAFSLKVINCPALNNDRLKSSFEFIKDIKLDSTDKRKLTLVCGKYVPEEALQIGDFAILPEHIVDPKGLLREFTLRDLIENYDSLSNHPKIKEFTAWFNSDRFTRDKNFLRGSGGYELTAWETGQYVQLQKKQDWWGDEVSAASAYIKAVPKKITFQIIPDNSTALLALKNKQIDVYAGIPVNSYRQLVADNEFKQTYNLFTPETYDFTYLGLNARLGKFADARTRQAMAHLFDVNKIIQATQGGFAFQTVGPIIPTNNQFYNKELKPYNYNLNQAVALLQAAGWVKNENGWQKNINGEVVPLTVNLNYKAGNTEFENIALIFQQAAAKINIPVTVQALEGKLLSQSLKAHNFEMFIRSLSGNPFVYNFKPILHTESAAEGGGNYTGFGTPESDNLIDQINETQDLQVKARLLKRLQQILHDQSNLIFLYFSKDRLAINKRFTNLKVSGIKPGYDVSAFELKKD